MSKGHRHGRDLHPVRAAARALGMSGSTLVHLDPDGLRFVIANSSAGSATGIGKSNQPCCTPGPGSEGYMCG